MSTTREDIRTWFKEGVAKGATHVVVVCDTFDYEDYPIFVMPADDVVKTASEHDGPNMQKVMEVYDLGMDMEAQLDEKQALHGWPSFLERST